jgi:putative ATP-binding cassette transporter
LRSLRPRPASYAGPAEIFSPRKVCLDAEEDWESGLSLQDQQLLAFAHILLLSPSFVFMDRVGSSIDPQVMGSAREALRKRSIGCVVSGDADSAHRYDAVLEFKEDGSWTWTASTGA